MHHPSARGLRLVLLLVIPVSIAAALAPRPLPVPDAAAPPTVHANDNRKPAGHWKGDTLFLNLEVRMARWYPEAEPGPNVDAPVFAEVGKAPQIPGPLIRAHAGATIVATVTNALTDSTLRVRGLNAHPAPEDSLSIRPGESRTVRFAAGEPGTYLYYAIAGALDTLHSEREQLAGALVVDSTARPDPDRIFVINIWGQGDSTGGRNALAINGKGWPYTERVQAQTGDTARWRVINASGREHPMHMHGFYFLITARGDNQRDTALAAPQQRLMVTEPMEPRTTMEMRWSSDRPGNWLFHCHIAFHVVPEAARLDPDTAAHETMHHDAMHHMAGLALGIQVRPGRGWHEPSRAGAERLHLFVDEGKRHARAPRALGFVLQRGATPPAVDSLERPGSVIVTHVGTPTDIVVHNRLKEATGVHWHGLELESWSDGIVGWSGQAPRQPGMAPPIMPGDSFVARLTTPRAGTFMYHTHLNDVEQLTSGLYGAIVVLPAGTTFDPAHDHPMVIGWDGPGGPPLTPRLINLDTLPPPLVLDQATHRFRFVFIGAAAFTRIRLLQNDSTLQRWRYVAKDGADLPPAQVSEGNAEFLGDTGQTWDVLWTPPGPGTYTLRLGPRARREWARTVIVR